jgi:hypothetical protein
LARVEKSADRNFSDGLVNQKRQSGAAFLMVHPFTKEMGDDTLLKTDVASFRGYHYEKDE